MSIFSKYTEQRKQEFDSHVGSDIRALIERGNVTPAELAELRMNSWEREALVPAMTDEALAGQFEYTLNNCSIQWSRPCSTYDEALVALFAPELLKRFKVLGAAIESTLQRQALVSGDGSQWGEAAFVFDPIRSVTDNPLTPQERQSADRFASEMGFEKLITTSTSDSPIGLLELFSNGSGPGLTESLFPSELFDSKKTEGPACSVCGATSTPLDGCRGTGRPCTLRREILK